MSGRGGIARGAVVAALVAFGAEAQTVTTISADTAAGLGTGTVIQPVAAVTRISGGARVGGNLFHSFAAFSLAQGQTAQWIAAGNAGSVANIINRVTGGGLSTIAGTLDSSQFPSANFFFLNPAGIVFTASASINIPGAAYFSTADRLDFTDGASFSVSTPQGSVLTVAAPESFGFIGGQGALGADSAGLAGARALNLSASDLTLAGTTIDAGALTLAAVGQGALDVPIADPTLASALVSGTLILDRSTITIGDGVDPARAVITAGVIEQTGGALTARGDDSGTGLLTVAAAGDIMLGEGATLSSEAEGVAFTSSIAITAANLRLTDGASIATLHASTDEAFPEGTEETDYVNAPYGGITADIGDAIALTGGSAITTTSRNYYVPAGLITLNAQTITLDGSTILSNGEDSGASQLITINATGVLDVGHDSTIASISVTGTNRSGTEADEGFSGSISITSDALNLHHGSSIFIESSFANAGEIEIAGGDITLSSDALISNDTTGGAYPGSIIVSGRGVTGSGFLIRSGGGADTFGDFISIDVTDNIDVSNAVITAASVGSAGETSPFVIIKAGSDLAFQGTISAASQYGGGNDFGATTSITISAANLAIGANSRIDASVADGQTGSDIIINAGSVTIADGTIITARTGGSAEGGRVAIASTGPVLFDGTTVSAETDGFSSLGVSISGSAITLRDSEVLSSATGPGEAGGILLESEGSISVTGGTIAALTFGDGSGGSINIASGGEIRLDGAKVTAASVGAETGGGTGEVAITARAVVLANGGVIETSSANTSGAGLIDITAKSVVVTGAESQIRSENIAAEGGDAGFIGIDSTTIDLLDGGTISTDSLAGAAGDIGLTLPETGRLTLAGGALPGVITTSSGARTGGRITIAAPFLVLSDGGRILALGDQAGANVDITSDFFVQSADRVNLLSVDGQLVLNAQVQNLSSGTVRRNPGYVVPAPRTSCAPTTRGGVSRLSRVDAGPYARGSGRQADDREGAGCS